MYLQSQQRIEGTIFVLNDDERLRERLVHLFHSAGLPTAPFCCTETFLAAPFPEVPHCIILDVRINGKSGLALQQRLNTSSSCAACVFLSKVADVRTSVSAMKAGAVDFLTTPFRDQDLVDAVYEGLSHSSARWSSKHHARELQKGLGQLTPRELEVMQLVVRGLLNKQVAGRSWHHRDQLKPSPNWS